MSIAQETPIIRTRPLDPSCSDALMRFFGRRGACGGCWCQWWRVERGGKLWDANKGEPNRKALESQIREGSRCGMLAYAGDELVGWCAFDPRSALPRLDTVKVWRGHSDAAAWSIHCFFIAQKWRGKGVARALLRASLDHLRKLGARVVEAYPHIPKGDAPIPAPFAWMGPAPLFEGFGFAPVPDTPPHRPILRLALA